MAKYTDIRIIADDIALDGDGLPLLVSDRDSIRQDILHAVRESGLLVALVGMRDPEMRRLYVQKIARLVEDDVRVRPGSVTMTETEVPGTYSLTAVTTEYGSLEIVV